jgi:hypothetical protein
MRRSPLLLFLLASCGSDQSLEYDLEPILLARAPIVPGGEALGGLLANVTTQAGIEPLLIDSAYPFNSLSRSECVGGGTPGWTYTGDITLHDGGTPSAAVRASFRNVDLFDLCPGTTGDAATQPAGVMGGPLLTNFAVRLVLPRSADGSATMTLWPSFPGADDQLERDGLVPLHFALRGSASVGQGNDEPSVTLPNSRIVLAACAAPRSFSTTEPQETCARGEVALKASGQNLLLAVGTGEGPLILSQPAWESIAAQTGMASDAGNPGDLYTPFSATPTPARFLTLPRLAVLQGTIDNSWTGACAELARARRIEWVLANQASGACFQPCDVSDGKALTTRPYLELGDSLSLAVVSVTSDLMQSLNVDTGTNPQVDGIIGAGVLAGTRLELDYPSQSDGRFIAACENGSTRDACWAAPSCPGLSANGKTICFGQPVPDWAPVCP